MSGIFKAVGKIFGGLFGGDDDAPAPIPPAPVAPPPPIAPPPVAPPPVMPTVDDAAVKKAKRKSLAAQQSRQGRQSTILTSADDALGG